MRKIFAKALSAATTKANENKSLKIEIEIQLNDKTDVCIGLLP